MIVSVRPGSDPAKVSRELVARGLWVRRFDDGAQVQFLVEPHSRAISADALRNVSGVSSVWDAPSPHPRLDACPSAVTVGDVKIGFGLPPVLLAGPCAVENEEQIEQTAAEVKALGATFLRGGAYKPRTSPHSFQGHGSKALSWLRRGGAIS